MTAHPSSSDQERRQPRRPEDDTATTSARTLLPAHIAERIPSLYETSGDTDPLVHCKLFTPWAGWSWFITEYDGEDLCFGLVDGHERELGYFSLKEMAQLQGPGGLRIERDESFSPMPLSRVHAMLEQPVPMPSRYAARER